MKLSFVIPFHSARIGNLLQTVRLLAKREAGLHGSELVLVCQDATKPISVPGFDARHINLGLNTYHRGRAVNTGVAAAANDIIVILDSDRVLPAGYFTTAAASLRPSTAATAARISELPSFYSDDEIDAQAWEFTKDEARSPTAEPEMKNLFSGNTMMWRADYLRCGGFDEGYIGYGFNDNDMTLTAMRAGVRPVFHDAVELHLYHPKEFFHAGSPVASYGSVMCAINCMRFMDKWGVKPTDKVADLMGRARKALQDAPEHMRTRFLAAANKHQI